MTALNERDSPGLSVRGLSKKFCKNLRRAVAYGLADVTRSALGIRPDTRTLRRDEFWAVDTVSFELRRGEALGIIGSNGSGKTTLLRILASILAPDAGEATLQGRVATLLSPVVGFHPYLTLRENIFINGTILGMSRDEIGERMDHIMAFSGLDTFINAPAGALSAGMQVRLGFSIALARQADILLVDELLSVADNDFRRRCIERIRTNRENAVTLFVSHTMEMVREVCTRIMVMDHGTVAYAGSDIGAGIDFYHSRRQ